MKNKHLCVIFALIAILFVASCQKKESITTNNSFIEKADTFIYNGDTVIVDSVTITYVYFLDGSQVSSGTFSLDDPDYIFAGEGVDDKDNNPATAKMKVHAFTTEQEYFDYGASKGVDLELYATIANHLREYANDNGYVEEYEETGEVSQDYLDYQSNYIDSMLAKSAKNAPSTKSLISMLHKNWVGGSSWPILIGAHPTMPLTYNNNVSAFTPLFIGGVTVIYDNWFFYNHLWTYFGWSFTKITFSGPLDALDNRASSWIQFGI